MKWFLSVGLLISILPSIALAGVPECDGLKGQAAIDAKSVMESEFMYDCCDDTISKCLANNPACRALAERLARHVCRRAAAGDGRAAIVRSLEKRAISMTGAKTGVPQSFKPGAVFGDPSAPVVIVMYVCARCPFCSKLIPKIHHEVESGRLAGLARIVLRPFPIKSHANSAEANLAFAASVELGRGWEFLLEAYRRFDNFSVAGIPDMAAAAGLDGRAFETSVGAAATRESLVESKKEGLKLGVEATPTLFINGRLYQSELEIEALVDIVQEIVGR